MSKFTVKEKKYGFQLCNLCLAKKKKKKKNAVDFCSHLYTRLHVKTNRKEASIYYLFYDYQLPNINSCNRNIVSSEKENGRTFSALEITLIFFLSPYRQKSCNVLPLRFI